MTAEEPPLEPERPIIDPHLHLWEILPSPGSPQAPQRFLLPEALETIAASGHRITHSVFVECHAMYRPDGPPELRSLGETEFANGQAAISASGGYGPARLAHRIVAGCDLRLGAGVERVLEAHRATAGERFRGIRASTAWSEAGMFGFPCDPAARAALSDPAFRQGARVLARLGLTLDVWCFHTQLDELTALADAVPGLIIILDHLGTPETQGAWAGRAAEAREDWALRIGELARRPNVRVKLGGMGMDLSRSIGEGPGDAASEELAQAWAPYVETCVAAFGADRCMFESNFPPDRETASYGATWNAFKRIAQGCSEAEKDRLFRRTAAETYHIALDD